ncbi:unnamed protein product (macronuclear) [Paramecium tetraurelia]|uniref:Major facilitator superfamily associated domain-containing protein n=1 Tax=Paramecium tetraurelia TaxID=5888 RepID=A0DDE3_PARTE|nr:uncharacterized protein GSPATT00015919001 [Paramecium tetraurelia]CAK81060.1 unnamed protein product [Paramecium tetraurelia]|eukprot:XP_001448457.1 hypothetical protein (macronuclear) [Paramecium tetraurelia strain d4-2]
MHAKEEIEMNEFQIEDPQELSVQEQISEKMKPAISNPEIKAIIRFTVLYFVIGIPAGFYSSLTLLLQGSGISSGQMAFWVTSFYPLSFKLILAPFVDSFYIAKFGKRKTYVIPSLYMVGFTFLTLAYSGYSQWIEHLNLYPLFGLTILLTVLQACATIATNGWVLSSFSKHYVHLGATCQMVGLSLGYVFSYAILMNITSPYFCHQYLGLDQPIISLNSYTYILGSLILFIAILTQCLVTEDPVEEEKTNFISVLKLSFSLLSNSNLRFLLLFLLTRRFAFAPVIASTSLNLIQMGFPQSEYATIEAICTTSWILSSLLVAKYLQRGKEMTWVLNAYYFMFLVMGAHFVYVISFIKMGGYNNFTQTLYFVLQYLYEFNNSFISCTLSGFFLRIADPAIGGTYATLLFSSYLFGTQFSASVSLFLLHLLPYKTVVLLGWLYGLIYFTVIKDKLIKLQYFDLKSWKVM